MFWDLTPLGLITTAALAFGFSELTDAYSAVLSQYEPFQQLFTVTCFLRDVVRDTHISWSFHYPQASLALASALSDISSTSNYLLNIFGCVAPLPASAVPQVVGGVIQYVASTFAFLRSLFSWTSPLPSFTVSSNHAMPSYSLVSVKGLDEAWLAELPQAEGWNLLRTLSSGVSVTSKPSDVDLEVARTFLARFEPPKQDYSGFLALLALMSLSIVFAFMLLTYKLAKASTKMHSATDLSSATTIGHRKPDTSDDPSSSSETTHGMELSMDTLVHYSGTPGRLLRSLKNVWYGMAASAPVVCPSTTRVMSVNEDDDGHAKVMPGGHPLLLPAIELDDKPLCTTSAPSYKLKETRNPLRGLAALKSATDTPLYKSEETRHPSVGLAASEFATLCKKDDVFDDDVFYGQSPTIALKGPTSARLSTMTDALASSPISSVGDAAEMGEGPGRRIISRLTPQRESPTLYKKDDDFDDDVLHGQSPTVALVSPLTAQFKRIEDMLDDIASSPLCSSVGDAMDIGEGPGPRLTAPPTPEQPSSPPRTPTTPLPQRSKLGTSRITRSVLRMCRFFVGPLIRVPEELRDEYPGCSPWTPGAAERVRTWCANQPRGGPRIPKAVLTDSVRKQHVWALISPLPSYRSLSQLPSSPSPCPARSRGETMAGTSRRTFTLSPSRTPAGSPPAIGVLERRLKDLARSENTVYPSVGLVASEFATLCKKDDVFDDDVFYGQSPAIASSPISSVGDAADIREGAGRRLSSCLTPQRESPALYKKDDVFDDDVLHGQSPTVALVSPLTAQFKRIEDMLDDIASSPLCSSVGDVMDIGEGPGPRLTAPPTPEQPSSPPRTPTTPLTQRFAARRELESPRRARRTPERVVTGSIRRLRSFSLSPSRTPASSPPAIGALQRRLKDLARSENTVYPSVGLMASECATLCKKDDVFDDDVFYGQSPTIALKGPTSARLTTMSDALASSPISSLGDAADIREGAGRRLSSCLTPQRESPALYKKDDVFDDDVLHGQSPTVALVSQLTAQFKRIEDMLDDIESSLLCSSVGDAMDIGEGPSPRRTAPPTPQQPSSPPRTPTTPLTQRFAARRELESPRRARRTPERVVTGSIRRLRSFSLSPSRTPASSPPAIGALQRRLKDLARNENTVF